MAVSSGITPLSSDWPERLTVECFRKKSDTAAEISRSPVQIREWGPSLSSIPKIWEFNHIRNPLNELYFGYPLPVYNRLRRQRLERRMALRPQTTRADLANGVVKLDDPVHQKRFLDWVRDDPMIAFRNREPMRLSTPQYVAAETAYMPSRRRYNATNSSRPSMTKSSIILRETTPITG